MLNTDLYNMSGNVVGTIELSEAIFGVTVNEKLLHLAVVNQLANMRQGTQSTKTKSEVRGGGRKPWKQKGTGRARQGSIRSAQWIKGGIALGPKPRSYRYSLTKKSKRLALKSALASKFNENELLILEQIKFEEIKTKRMINVLENLKIDSSVAIILADKDLFVERSTRNIPGAKTLLVNTINVFDLLKYNKLIITKDALEKLEEVYS